MPDPKYTKPWHGVPREQILWHPTVSAQTKTITLKDLIKFHGHFCGGLVEGATTLRVAFDRLFPEGVIDRTDLRIASNNSACGGDVAAYLSGTRTRFGSHYIDPALKEGEFLVQRLSTQETVRVGIDAATYPHDVRAQMRKIESGTFTSPDLDSFQDLQWEYARKLVNRPPEESVDMAQDTGCVWPDPPCKDMGERRDNLYKGVAPTQ